MPGSSTGGGQRRVLNLLALTNAAALCVLAALLLQGVDTLLVLGTVAVLTGLSTPPLGASMRVLWASVTPAGPIRTCAYSLDAVAEELNFTTGPVAIAAIIAATSPLAGLLVTAPLVLTGTIGMTSGPGSAQHTEAPHRLASEGKPLRQKGFIPNLIILLGVVIVLGAIEVAVPATADQGTSVTLATVLGQVNAGRSTQRRQVGGNHHQGPNCFSSHTSDGTTGINTAS